MVNLVARYRIQSATFTCTFDVNSYFICFWIVKRTEIPKRDWDWPKFLARNTCSKTFHRQQLNYNIKSRISKSQLSEKDKGSGGNFHFIQNQPARQRLNVLYREAKNTFCWQKGTKGTKRRVNKVKVLTENGTRKRLGIKCNFPIHKGRSKQNHILPCNNASYKEIAILSAFCLQWLWFSWRSAGLIQSLEIVYTQHGLLLLTIQKSEIKKNRPGIAHRILSLGMIFLYNIKCIEL